MARVFISYASQNLARALEVASWLTADGHQAFVDQDPSRGLTVGEDWERQLRDRLRWADVVVCLITAAYARSVWCSTEALFARWLGSVVVPVLSERDAEHPLLRFPVQYADLTSDHSLARERLIEAVRRTDQSTTNWSHRESPYPGLRAFDAGLRGVFFGRAVETADLARAVRSPVADGCLLVIGPSGSGKSSLVRAGLVPVIAGEPGWLTLPPFTPGTDPSSALVRELVSAGRRRGLGWTVADVRAGCAGDLVEELLIGAGGRCERLLVVIDQLEELLTQTPDDRKRSFAHTLIDLSAAPVQLVATVRSEFVDRLLADADLRPLAGPTFAVKPLGQAQLRSVVEGPARLAGISVSEELLQRLVADTDDGSALPLLAFTLAQLAADRRGSELSPARYDELGGVRGALVKQADAALREAVGVTGRTPDEVITGLLELVTVDDHDQPVRGRVVRSVLPDSVAAEMDVFIAHRLLTTDDDGALTVAHEAFLTAWQPMASAITAEATALRARGAIDRAAASWETSGRAVNRLWERNQLAAAVADVAADVPPVFRRGGGGIRTSRVELGETSRAFLLAGVRRDRMRRGWLTTVLSALLVVASVAAGMAVVQQREAEHQQRIAASRALVSRAEAGLRDDPQLALMLGVAAIELNPGLDTKNSLTESLTSTHYGGTITGHTGEVTAVGFARDKRTLATAGADRAVILSDLADPLKPRELKRLTGHRFTVTDLAFSPVAPLLVTVDGAGGVILWDVEDPARATRIWQSPDRDRPALTSVAISPDGRTLATGGGASSDRPEVGLPPGGVQLWDITVPAEPREISRLSSHELMVLGLAFHPDGRTLASAAMDGSVALWDTSDPARAFALAALPREPDARWQSVAFSPDGRTLAGVGAGRTPAVLWDVTDRTRLSRIAAPPASAGGFLHDVVFSPDGAMLVAVGQDRSVVRWDVRRPAEPLALPSFHGHARGVEAVAFHPDGGYLVTGGHDRVVMLWHVRNPAGAVQSGEPLTGHVGEVERLEFRPDGRVLVSTGDDGQITFWDTRDHARPRRIHRFAPGHREELSALAFSADGRLLATGSHDGAVKLWDVSDPAAPVRIDQPISERAGRVLDLAFLPAGGQLLVCGSGGQVFLWDMVSRRRTAVPVDMPLLPNSAAFGGDGTLLAYGGPGPGRWLWDVRDPRNLRAITTQLDERDGYAVESAFAGDVLAVSSTDITVVLWDLRDPTRPLRLGQPLTGHESLVSKMAFSADRQTLLTVDSDRAAILWNVSAPDHPRRIGPQLPSEGAAALSVDGRTVASKDGDGVVLWDLSGPVDAREHPVERACERAGRGLTREEWEHHVGPGYRETCRSPGR
ncbi:hypothetical protein BBK82_00225 [Lentzea guizhouensis]|uniref:TIR domain-containing protein n=1 Tax=Lentzea guizhouensis TaxID=1586287 RepID=A0A1B2HAJ7_9PSEU|nr:TIR domain-containing protein [Lentzea guizhouensis]ANZ34736.1 hypothetical protein BBK82_00225 [Lentzea guizhouensis]